MWSSRGISTSFDLENLTLVGFPLCPLHFFFLIWFFHIAFHLNKTFQLLGEIRSFHLLYLLTFFNHQEIFLESDFYWICQLWSKDEIWCSTRSIINSLTNSAIQSIVAWFTRRRRRRRRSIRVTSSSVYLSSAIIHQSCVRSLILKKTIIFHRTENFNFFP